MLLEAATVAAILGTRLPPSTVVVGNTKTPSYHSVHYFDNKEVLNLTNRVLDRSIRADVVAQQTNLQNGVVYVQAAKRQQQAMEQHCKLRLVADGIKDAARECGNGLLSR